MANIINKPSNELSSDALSMAYQALYALNSKRPIMTGDEFRQELQKPVSTIKQTIITHIQTILLIRYHKDLTLENSRKHEARKIAQQETELLEEKREKREAALKDSDDGDSIEDPVSLLGSENNFMNEQAKTLNEHYKKLNELQKEITELNEKLGENVKQLLEETKEARQQISEIYNNEIVPKVESALDKAIADAKDKAPEKAEELTEIKQSYIDTTNTKKPSEVKQQQKALRKSAKEEIEEDEEFDSIKERQIENMAIVFQHLGLEGLARRVKGIDSSGELIQAIDTARSEFEKTALDKLKKPAETARKANAIRDEIQQTKAEAAAIEKAVAEKAHTKTQQSIATISNTPTPIASTEQLRI